jgi:hypothetical protein
MRRAGSPAAGGSAQAPAEPAPHGIFIATGPDEIYLAGSGLTVTFSPNTPEPPIAGLGSVEEGHFAAGRWVSSRALAGDDTGQRTGEHDSAGHVVSIPRRRQSSLLIAFDAQWSSSIREE